jgi:predicted phosphodiesterase
MDDKEVRQRLPKKQTLSLEKIRIGLIHGEGAPKNLIAYINNEFSKELDTIDIFVFGHSHYPTDTVVNGKIYFNAGSPTDRIFTPYVSYGILEVQGSTIKRRIVKIE